MVSEQLASTHSREADLIRRAVTGERHCFEELVQPHLAKMRRLVYRSVRNEHDVDDVMQEVLLKAYAHLHGFRGESQLGSWLCSIVVNQVAQHHRGTFRTRHFSTIESDGSRHVADNLPSPFEQVQQTEQHRALHRSIARLPVEYQSAVRLFHLQGLSLLEAARLMGVSEGAAKARLFRARAKLATMLARHLGVK